MQLANRLTVALTLFALAACDTSTSTAAPTAPVKANAAAVPAAKPASWLDVVVATPDGGIRQGTPSFS